MNAKRCGHCNMRWSKCTCKLELKVPSRRRGKQNYVPADDPRQSTLAPKGVERQFLGWWQSERLQLNQSSQDRSRASEGDDSPKES